MFPLHLVLCIGTGHFCCQGHVCGHLCFCFSVVVRGYFQTCYFGHITELPHLYWYFPCIVIILLMYYPFLGSLLMYCTYSTVVPLPWSHRRYQYHWSQSHLQVQPQEVNQGQFVDNHMWKDFWCIGRLQH